MLGIGLAFAIGMAARIARGEMLIEQAFAAQVGGSASLEYTADGVVCTLECQHL
jgi:hypothetical protein